MHKKGCNSMLRIFYGELDTPEYIFNPDVYFNNTYDDEWITDQMSRINIIIYAIQITKCLIYISTCFFLRNAI